MRRHICAREDCKQYQAETMYIFVMLFHKYLRSSLEPIVSSFNSDRTEEWLIRLLLQVSAVDRNKVAGLILGTFGGYLESRKHPEWSKKIELDLNQLIPEMLRLKLLEGDSSFIRLSLLGTACARSSLPLSSSMRLVEILERNQNLLLNIMTLLALIQYLPESDVGFIPILKRGHRERVWPANASSIVDTQVVSALQFGAKDTFEYAARCKRLCILHDWINGVAIDKIESSYTVNPFYSVGRGDVVRIADNTRYHLSSAVEIALIIDPSADLSPEKVDSLLVRLQVGLPEKGLNLLKLPFEMTRGEYLALLDSDITSSEEFWSCSNGDLSQILGENRSQLFLKFRPNGN